jgi:hypothetical protein
MILKEKLALEYSWNTITGSEDKRLTKAYLDGFKAAKAGIAKKLRADRRQDYRAIVLAKTILQFGEEEAK